METLATSAAPQGTVTVTTGASGGTVANLAAAGGVQTVWYADGGALQQLVPATAANVVEVDGARWTVDLSRQFTQQMQTPYGPVQVQVPSVPTTQLVTAKMTQQQEIDDSRTAVLAVTAAPSSAVTAATTPVAPKSRSSRAAGGERVPCTTCGKTVSCNATLRDHMRTHTGERPFVCSECGLAFAQRSNLRMHKRLHTGERPYMCGVCGKTFARSSHLPAHMRTHTGEKPFVCEQCNHAFITAQQLKNHFRVHTGEKPWKCEQCPAAFTHSSSLSTHKKKHTGRKPYQCEKCQKCFFFTSALEKHMKVHSKSRPFMCTVCEKAFKYKESLTVHKEKYCGREVAKKPRAPRRADARKPGPKPGSGRKYVQKRKGRPRGRPRKRGRWSQRIRAKRSELRSDEEDGGGADGMAGEDDAVKNEQLGDGVKMLEEDEEEMDGLDEEEEVEDEEDEEDEENIPTAELKVEVISPEEAAAIHMGRSGGSALASGNIVATSIAAANSFDGVVDPGAPAGVVGEHPEQITGDLLHMQQTPQEIHLDENTALTIVSAEEAEQQVAAGGVQLVTLAPGVPLQFVQHDGAEDGAQVTHQLITRDGVHMWYPRQFQ